MKKNIIRRLFWSILLFFVFPCSIFAVEPMHFVYFDNYYPRSFLENGKMKGVLIDIVNQAATNYVGIKAKHSGYPWKRAQSMVQNGTADAFITVPTETRLKYTKCSQQNIISFNLKIITRADHPQIKKIETISRVDQLSAYTIVDYHGNGWAKQNLQGMDVQWLTNIDALFPFLLDERADIIIASDRTINAMNRQGYASRLKVIPNVISTTTFNLCVGARSYYIGKLDDFDQAFKVMHEEGVIQKIHDRYFEY